MESALDQMGDITRLISIHRETNPEFPFSIQILSQPIDAVGTRETGRGVTLFLLVEPLCEEQVGTR